MKRKLKPEFKDINFDGSFILYSFVDNKSYIISKIFSYWSVKNRATIRPNVISGYQLQPGDELKSVKEEKSTNVLKLGQDNNQSYLNKFLGNLSPGSKIEISYQRKLGDKNISRSLKLSTQNWKNYIDAKFDEFSQYLDHKKEKTEIAIKEWENQFFEGYPEFTEKRLDEIKTMVVTLEEKLLNNKLKPKYKNLNIKGSFLPFEFKYDEKIKGYEIVSSCGGSSHFYPMPEDFDSHKYGFKSHDDLIKSKDILISVEKENSNEVLNLQNINDPDLLYKFLGKTPRFIWIKVIFKRKKMDGNYLTKTQWYSTQNFDEFCSDLKGAFEVYFHGGSREDEVHEDYPEDIAQAARNALKKWKENLLEEYPDFDLANYYNTHVKNQPWKKPIVYLNTKVKKSEHPLTDVYFLHLLAVDVGTILLGDLKEGFGKPINLSSAALDGNADVIEKEISEKNKHKSNSLCIETGGDGGFNFYAGVDRFNKVNKIFAETAMRTYGPYSNRGLQPNIAPIFPSYVWAKEVFNNQFFKKGKVSGIKNKKRIKVFDLKISSKFILLDDNNPYRYEISEVVEKEFEEKYYSKKNIPMDVDQAFPVNNGAYPVYLHYYYLEDKEYPEDCLMIVIEDIQGCYLNKDENGKLVFQRDFLPSQALEKQIKSDAKKAYIDKIDLRDTQSLKVIEKLKNVESLTLCGVENIKDCSPLYKLKKLKTLYLVDCGALNLKKISPFKVKIKKMEK